MTARFPIGLEFEYYTVGGQKRSSRIVDILTTRNSAGETVQIEYIAVHRGPLDQDIRERFSDIRIAKTLPAKTLEQYL